MMSGERLEGSFWLIGIGTIGGLGRGLQRLLAAHLEVDWRRLWLITASGLYGGR
jgi:hypothetical protein